MKIKKWEDLDGVENNKYHLEFAEGYSTQPLPTIQIREADESYIGEFRTERIEKSDAISILKLFGFDVEFEEKPKLSKRAWHLVNFLPVDMWIAKDSSGFYINIYNSKPEFNGLMEWWYGNIFISVENYLLPFITPNKAWSVKELRELEVEDE